MSREAIMRGQVHIFSRAYIAGPPDVPAFEMVSPNHTLAEERCTDSGMFSRISISVGYNIQSHRSQVAQTGLGESHKLFPAPVFVPPPHAGLEPAAPAALHTELAGRADGEEPHGLVLGVGPPYAVVGGKPFG